MAPKDYELIRLNGSHECGDGRIEKVKRGFAVVLPEDPERLSPWHAQNLVDRARIEAVDAALSAPHAFAMESVLILEDLPMWRRNPDVHVRVPGRYSTTALPTVSLGPHRISPVSVRQCRAGSLPPVVESPTGIAHDALAHTAVLLTARRPLLDGFVAVSGILRRLSSFDRFDIPASRAREARARSGLLECLDSLGALHGRGRAGLVLAHADAGCESAGESAALAVLSTIGLLGLQTQHEVIVAGRRYFIDLALPGARIGFEFDGVVKMGKTPEEFRRAQAELMARQRDLEDAGWLIIRIGWNDLLDPRRLRGRVVERITGSGRWKGSRDREAQRLWALMMHDLS